MQKNYNEKTRDRLYKILLKRAEGFYYKEICEEFVFENKSKNNKQISFFDDENKIINSKKRVTKNEVDENLDIELECSKTSSANLESDCEDIKKPTLAKKKVTTHFVPPDMLAIKMLLEIDKKVGTDFSQMSDAELLAIAKELETEIKEGE